MAKLKLTLPVGEVAVTGKQVSFIAPCGSAGLTHVIIEGSEFELVDSNGNSIIDGAFKSGAMVSVILNVDNYKAYIQNADINSQLKQVFAPAGYSEEHIIVTEAGEMDERLTAVFDSMGDRTKKVVYVSHNIDESNTIGVDGGNWFFSIYKYASDYGVIEGISYYFNTSNPPRKVIKNKASGIWGSWTKCGSSAFAPARYGLGTGAVAFNLAGIDDMKSNGWFYTSSSTGYYISTVPLYYLHLRVDSWKDTEGSRRITQTLYHDNCLIRRITDASGNTWGEWEWVNPPMEMGVEYRTIERIDGKAVYKKRLFSPSAIIQYRLDGEAEWKDYAPVYGAAPTVHNQSANTITEGTFAGRVAAHSTTQAANVPLIRNTKLVSTETDPKTEGEIFWTYE